MKRLFIGLVLVLSLGLFTACDEGMNFFPTPTSVEDGAEIAAWWDSMSSDYIGTYYRALHKLMIHPWSMTETEWVLMWNLMRLSEDEAYVARQSGFLWMYQPIPIEYIIWDVPEHEMLGFAQEMVEAYLEGLNSNEWHFDATIPIGQEPDSSGTQYVGNGWYYTPRDDGGREYWWDDWTGMSFVYNRSLNTLEYSGEHFGNNFNETLDSLKARVDLTFINRSGYWEPINKDVIPEMAGLLSYTDGRWEFHAVTDAVTVTSREPLNNLISLGHIVYIFNGETWVLREPPWHLIGG
jgi:hypothetical protein